MNLLKYTLTAKFVTYLVITLITTLIMVAMLSAMEFTTGVYIAFAVFITFWVAAIISRCYHYYLYRQWQKTDAKLTEARETIRKFLSYIERKN